MLTLLAALALSTTPQARPAQGKAIFVAVNAEKASGFGSLAECERAIGAGRRVVRGSVFNRRAGNVTRCEMVQGEAVVVVYPKGYSAER